jgi:uncharacterized protein (DUF4415 family)
MSDSGIVNNGDAAKLVPVELKDHSKDPVIVDPKKRERTALEKEVDAEIISETCCAPKRKRGRPAKKTKVVREWYCATCREMISELNAMMLPAGDGGRAAVFCNNCQKSLGFLHPDLDKKVADLIKNNPTGK